MFDYFSLTGVTVLKTHVHELDHKIKTGSRLKIITVSMVTERRINCLQNQYLLYIIYIEKRVIRS